MMWAFWLCSSCCLGWGSQGCPGTVPGRAGTPGSSGSFCLAGTFPPSLSTLRPSAPSPAAQGCSSGEHPALVPRHCSASPILPWSQQARVPLHAPSRQGSGQARQELIKHHCQPGSHPALACGAQGKPSPCSAWLPSGSIRPGESQSTVLGRPSSFKY